MTVTGISSAAFGHQTGQESMIPIAVARPLLEQIYILLANAESVY